MFRVIVTGDRHWYCPDVAERVLDRLDALKRLHHKGDIVIVHGNATGVDSAFEHIAVAKGIATEKHPANWVDKGRAAGPIRNQEMIDAGAEMVIAVHRDLGNSKGTKDCVRRAKAAGIPVFCVVDDDGVLDEP